MKITNKLNLPDSIVRAVSFSDYDAGKSDYSVTGLISPARIVALKKKHAEEIESDAADMIWALIGSSAHEVLRRSSSGAITEKRFFADISGVKISGQVDMATSDNEMFDYKIQSVWAMRDGLKKEHEQQMNCYRWLCAQNGIKINKMTICCIGRDWSAREAKRDSAYPQHQIILFHVPVWDLSETERFLKERIALHEAAKVTLPECSPEDRWQKDDAFAVMKVGRKSAVKVHYKRELADQHLAVVGKGHYLQERKGTSIRCESYCSVAPFCDFWQKNKPKEDPETNLNPEEAM